MSMEDEFAQECIFLTCFHFPIYSNKRLTLLSVINGIGTNILLKRDSGITKELLYGKIYLNKTRDSHILKATIVILLEIKRFE